MVIRYSTFTSIIPYFDPAVWGERRQRLPPVATMHAANDWFDFVLAMAEMRYEWPADEQSKKYNAACVSPARYQAPKIARVNGNVVGWGAFMGIDLDDGDITLDEAKACFTEMGLNHLIYSTTKCTPEHWRLRVLFPISRELSCEEVPSAWRAMARYMAAFKPDAACNDLSRLYVAPMIWLPSTAPLSQKPNATPVTAFEYRHDLGALDIDDCMARFPDPPPPPRPVAMPIISSVGVNVPSIPASTGPLVAPRFVEEYLALGPGEHHVGLYRFMTQVAARAKALGRSISVQDLVHAARDVDQRCAFKRNAHRWRNIEKEATNALNHVASLSIDPLTTTYNRTLARIQRLRKEP